MKVDRRRVIGILVLVLAVATVMATAGCVTESTVPQQTIQEKNSNSWYNYDITDSPLYDTVDHTFAAKDNFYAYANADAIKNGTGDTSTQKDININNKISSVVGDTSYTGTEAELVRKTYTMLQDYATRDRLGVTPVLPAVEEIRSVSNLDELSALISSGGISSLKEAFVREFPTGSATDGAFTVFVMPAEFVLTDPSAYQNMTTENAALYSYLLGNFQKFLVNCGYTEEEAGHLAEELKKMEAELAPLCNSTTAALTNSDNTAKTNTPYTYEQFSSMAFPIAGDLKVYHDAGVTTYLVVNPAWLNKLNELYTPENIDGFKAVMLYNLFMTSTPFLTTDMQQQYFDNVFIKDIYPIIWQDEVQTAAQSGKTEPTKLSETGKVSMKSYASALAETRIRDDYLGMAVGKVLTDAYVPAGTKEKYTALTKEIIAAFGERLKNADWLSESTRNAALKKLSKMKIRVLYPDDWSYYSYDDVNYRDAENLYDLSVQLRKHNQALVVKNALQESGAKVWPQQPDDFVVPHAVNAFYSPSENSINILYGYVVNLIDNPNASEEEILGSAGVTIGHEITHGFDSYGSNIDGDGFYVNWWTDSDRRNFDAKVKKIADYYSGFEARPGEYLNGEILTAEATADFGGLSTVLDIARTRENFDYDKFFTSFAQMHYRPSTNAEYLRYLNDEHPPGMYRVNVGVQQYDEFNRTYNITEGDQMYLAPENRITIW